MRAIGYWDALTEHERLAAALPAYEVHGVLGRGAFGTVYAATHSRLGREVAIKCLSAARVADEAAVARFVTEAQLLASLDHPHLVRVYDYVEGEISALVMERLHGGTLGDRMRLGIDRSPARACGLMLATLHGLEHAHQHGVLHRDIKPDNLLFANGELLKVADFGLAKCVASAGAHLATAGALGTPAYMAPEQVSPEAGRLSPATDVWAVGAVLFELLAGRRAFSSDECLGDLLVRRVVADPPQLADLAPEIPPQIAAVAMRSLHRDPSQRYQSAREFADALERAADQAWGRGAIAATGIPVDARASVSPLHGTTVDDVSRSLVPASVDVAPAGRRRLVRIAPALAVVAVAAAIFGVLSIVSHKNADAHAPGIPSGWPTTMAFGWADPVQGPAGVATRGGELAVPTPDEAMARWNGRPERSPAAFVARAHRRRLVPYLPFYLLRVLGSSSPGVDANIIELRKTLVNERRMRAYWRQVRRFLRSVGSEGDPAAIAVEQSVFALLEQQLGFTGENPQSVPALVGATGLPELRGIEDDLLGFVRAWGVLRNRYAPHALLGYELADYGANVGIAKDLPPRPALLAAARESAEWYLLLSSPKTFDFAAFDVAYGEHGQNPGSQTNWTQPKKEALIDFLREWVRVADRPVVLESVPIGNSISRTINDRPYHWSDSWVQWLFGDQRRSLHALRDVGVIGATFGWAVGPDATCPCDAAHDGVTNSRRRGVTSRSADDDGGYLANRLAALNRAGGLPLR